MSSSRPGSRPAVPCRPSVGPVSAVDLHLLDLPLVEPFAAAHGTTWSRAVSAIRVTTGRGVGWGECSALPAATYSGESAAGSFELLVTGIAPLLVADDRPAEEVLATIRGRFGDHPMAVAAVEMALLDAGLRTDGRSLASWLGVEPRVGQGVGYGEVAAGVSLGLDDPPRVVAKARELVAEGYRRLKVKIQPGHDLALVRAILAEPGLDAGAVELQVDANGSYRPDAIDTLAGLARAGIDAIEQPFAPGEVEAAARLVARLEGTGVDRPGGRPVPVVGDEGVPSLAAARRLADRRAITGVSIKPARVGGLTVARDLHDLCRERGLVATAGGMLETGLGRHALAALAALPGFDLTGDLSPAGRWLAADPWPDLIMDGGRIAVPGGPGVAPEPDPDLIDRYTVRHERVERDGPAGRHQP